MEVNSFVIGYIKGRASVPAGGGDASFNIAYGDTAPFDKGKLWVKCDTPESVQVLPPSLVGANEAATVGTDGEITAVGTLGTFPSTNFACASVGTKIYTFGGHYKPSSTSYYTDCIRVFDTETSTVTTLDAKFETLMARMACAVVGKYIYLFGGACLRSSAGSYSVSEYSKKIYRFDTETLSLSMLNTETIIGVDNLSAVAVGTKIYVFGGRYYPSNSTTENITGIISVFDTETSTVTTLDAKLSPARHSMQCEVVGSKVYLLGGQGANSEKLNTIEVFDCETLTISTLDTKLPKGHVGAGCTKIGNEIYLFGGNNGSVVNTIMSFDTEASAVTTLTTTLPAKLNLCVAVNIGSKAYVLGGFNPSKATYDTTVYMFENSSFYLAQNNLIIVENLSENLFAILPNVIIGIDNVYIGNADNKAEEIDAAIYKDGTWVNI